MNQPLKSQEEHLFDIFYPNHMASSDISEVGLINFVSNRFRSMKCEKAIEIQAFFRTKWNTERKENRKNPKSNTALKPA